MGKDPPRTEIPPGTLYMLILRSLARLGPMHGYGIAQHIQQLSEDVLQVEEGSLYPALQRMLIKGWVTADWAQSENNRRARYYRLTTARQETTGGRSVGIRPGHAGDRQRDSARIKARASVRAAKEVGTRAIMTVRLRPRFARDP